MVSNALDRGHRAQCGALWSHPTVCFVLKYRNFKAVRFIWLKHLIDSTVMYYLYLQNPLAWMYLSILQKMVTPPVLINKITSSLKFQNGTKRQFDSEAPAKFCDGLLWGDLLPWPANDWYCLIDNSPYPSAVAKKTYHDFFSYGDSVEVSAKKTYAGGGVECMCFLIRMLEYIFKFWFRPSQNPSSFQPIWGDVGSCWLLTWSKSVQHFKDSGMIYNYK